MRVVQSTVPTVVAVLMSISSVTVGFIVHGFSDEVVEQKEIRHARAILYCAEHPRRSITVGGGGRTMAMMGVLAASAWSPRSSRALARASAAPIAVVFLIVTPSSDPPP